MFSSLRTLASQRNDSSTEQDFGVGSFNVRGLSSSLKKQQLADDLRKYKIKICSLQETKIKDDCDELAGDYRIFCLPTANRHYGLGFAIHNSLFERIHRIWSVSDRVAAIQINLSKRSTLSLVNAYAPTATRVAADYVHLDEFYSALGDCLGSVRSSSLVLVAGDFNAKLGQRDDSGGSCTGRYGRGRRNYSGAMLADFCESFGLFACNTAFQHPARHLTTWTGWRHNPNGGCSIPIYNQIDFILSSSNQKEIFTDARSYAGTLVKSVVARARLSRIYGLWAHNNNKKRTAKAQKFQVHRLSEHTCVKTSSPNSPIGSPTAQ